MARTRAMASPTPVRGGSSGGAMRATGLTLGLVLLSRVLGLLREKVVAYLFGQTLSTDATLFKQAFAVPDLIALVIAGGALSAVFVPIFTRYWTEKKQDDAWRVFGTVVSIAGAVVALLVIGMELFSVPLTRRLNPHFASPESIQKTAELTRILLPAQWFLLIGGLMQGTLYARKRFLIPGLAGIFYNLGQIVGGLAFSAQYGIAAMAWGATVGAFIGNILLPLYDMTRIGTRWRLGFDWRHPGVREVGLLMIPVILGQSLSQLNMWITGRLLSDDFRLATLNNAYTLTQAPIGIFAQAFGIVLLPTISAHAAEQNWPEFRRAVSEGLRRVLFLTIPASALMAALAVPLVRLLLKGGAYTEHDVGIAAKALVAYSVATFAWSAISILARGFYAIQDTKTPVYITTPMVALYALSGWLYTRFVPGGYLGLAIITSAIGTVTALLFLIALDRQVNKLRLGDIGQSALKMTLASIGAVLIAYPARLGLERVVGNSIVSALLIVVIAGGAGCAVYAVLCALMKVRELYTLKDLFRRKR